MIENKPNPKTHEEIVRAADLKAHKKNGTITILVAGSFRAIDDPMATYLRTTISLAPHETHFEAVEEAVAALWRLREGAYSLDRRIEHRSNQTPPERKYLYGDHQS